MSRFQTVSTGTAAPSNTVWFREAHLERLQGPPGKRWPKAPVKFDLVSTTLTIQVQRLAAALKRVCWLTRSTFAFQHSEWRLSVRIAWSEQECSPCGNRIDKSALCGAVQFYGQGIARSVQDIDVPADCG